MAKKAVASLQKGEGRGHAKVVKSKRIFYEVDINIA